MHVYTQSTKHKMHWPCDHWTDPVKANKQEQVDPSLHMTANNAKLKPTTWPQKKLN